jgi:hypothetical protein
MIGAKLCLMSWLDPAREAVDWSGGRGELARPAKVCLVGRVEPMIGAKICLMSWLDPAREASACIAHVVARSVACIGGVLAGVVVPPGLTVGG